MRFPRFSAALVAVALTVSACGDSTGGSTIELTETQAEALFEAISVALGEFGSFSASNPSLPGLFLSAVAEPITGSDACPGGGTISVNGEANETANGADFDMDVTFTNCVSQGHTIGGTLNYSGELEATDTDFSMEFNMNGSLNVTLPGGTSGTCAINVSMEFSGQSGSVSGSICGRNVSESV